MLHSAQLLLEAFAAFATTSEPSSRSSYERAVAAPEILEFHFYPNPVVIGHYVNVTCAVRPPQSQVLILRLLTNNYDHRLDYQHWIHNETVSIYSADIAGVTWNSIPGNISSSYICEARNNLGLVRSRSVNLIARNPVYTTVFIDLKTEAGRTVSNAIVRPAMCKATTTESDVFEYKWTFLSSNSSSEWILLPVSSASINVSAEESGVYKCAVRSDAGWSEWSPSVLVTTAIGISGLSGGTSKIFLDPYMTVPISIFGQVFLMRIIQKWRNSL
ncbi:uncharacterized protein LOC129581796 isoform X2 [Paramacrobiotus metropolitanus]|uniref:uncharacterized protein LOC129581796 isoform X2 n=1 Tax=Paramacrobiotus metropolitanus TaxID=2943436 RepID=UPI002445CCCF|nr:uncharacterized protein LOC129581796 isoform X2 [Paramacrobiotus metropolitanus]